MVAPLIFSASLLALHPRPFELSYPSLWGLIAYLAAFPPGDSDAGAPPSDFVSIGPVFPWGCVTFLLESVFVDGSLGFDCENAAGTAEKAKAAAMRTRIMAHLRGAHPKSTGRLEFRNYAHLTASR